MFDNVKQSSRLVGSLCTSSARRSRAWLSLSCSRSNGLRRDGSSQLDHQRHTVLHRQLNTPIPPVRNLHGQAKHGDELFGIKKFIDFKFSLRQGFCVARQFSEASSPVYVMSLSTENPTICQVCSDDEVRVFARAHARWCASAGGGGGAAAFHAGGSCLDQ